MEVLYALQLSGTATFFPGTGHVGVAIYLVLQTILGSVVPTDTQPFAGTPFAPTVGAGVLGLVEGGVLPPVVAGVAYILSQITLLSVASVLAI